MTIDLQSQHNQPTSRASSNEISDRSIKFKIAVIAGAVLLLAVGGSFLPSYYVGLLSQILIYAIFAMSLDLLVGYTGLPSLGHSAFFGFTAYVTGILTLRLGISPYLAVIVGLAAVVAMSAVFNFLTLRTAKAYYLMITLALSQVLWGIAVSWSAVTGGDNGLPGIPRPDFTMILPSVMGSEKAFYLFVLFIFIVSLALMLLIVSSPFGYALRGIRENERRMEALGYNTFAYKFVVSLISAFFAGVAGQLFLYLNSFVSPSTLGIALSAQVLLMVLVGAAGTLWGPIAGAILFVLLQNVVSSYTERWLLVVGVIYIAIALYAPRGALLLLFDRLKWFQRRAS